MTSLQVASGFPLSLPFAILKRPPSSYTSWVVGTWASWCLCPIFQCPWSGTYRTVGDTNPCRHQAEPRCAGHAPNVTSVQFALFTLGTCCCLMFYLASPVTPGFLQQCVPGLHWCVGLFCCGCRTWHFPCWTSGDFCWSSPQVSGQCLWTPLWYASCSSKFSVVCKDYKCVSAFRL